MYDLFLFVSENFRIQSTLSQRPLFVSDHLLYVTTLQKTVLFLSLMKCTCKHSRKRPLAEFLNDCHHFLNHKFDIFLCVSAPSKRPPGLITNVYKKTIARTSRSQSSDRFLKAPTKYADRLKQLTYKKDDCSAIYTGKGGF